MARTKRPARARRGTNNDHVAGPNGGDATDVWWNETTSVPRAGTPDAKKLGRRALTARIVIWSLVVLAPMALLLDIGLVNSKGASATTGTSASQAYVDTKPIAIQAVQEWLSSDPAPLPGGSLVSWDGATTRKPVKPTGNAAASSQYVPYRIETHHLTVAAGTTLFAVSVLIGDEAATGPVVLSAPSLTPLAASADSGFTNSQYPGWASATAPANAAVAVGQWASAYTSGDPAVLAQAVGDPHPNDVYTPLTGATLSNISITQTVAPAAGGAAANQAAATPEQVVVRITALLNWNAGQAAPQTPSGTPSGAPVEYDLLLARANTATPVVVAWGGAGTGPSLKPYANAATGRTAVTSPSGAAIPSTDSDPTQSQSTGDPNAADQPVVPTAPMSSADQVSTSPTSGPGGSQTGKTKHNKGVAQ